jgi:hypothetical protein
LRGRNARLLFASAKSAVDREHHGTSDNVGGEPKRKSGTN